MKPNIKLTLSKLTPVALLALLINVIEKMTGNIFFTTPAIAIAAMQSLADRLRTAIAEATDGSMQARQRRDALVQEVKAALSVQANYVRTTAAGSEVILGSSGFRMANPPQPIERVGIPQHVEANATGGSGQLELRFKQERGAHFYQMWQSDVDPATGNVKWVSIGTTTRSRNIISGLEPFKPYWFRVNAVGVNGAGLLSDVAMGRAA